MVNFYHRFIPHAAALPHPLHYPLKAKPKQIVWTEEMNTAFESSKIAIAGATLLSHPMLDAEISLTSDASDNAVWGSHWPFSASSSALAKQSTVLSTESC